ncbi:non-heme manganese-containing catalase [Gluconobacter morbifer G707]|uniref:Non-heme manganese-containing catalase n=2 Tax=Gluconobacter TaxID=441 RepID=G6XHB5_9PROT|nr:non-heme manganese-containing catalase [Gluconobacter morbifer G707]
MYHHVEQLMYTVRISEPDPYFGNMLLEQFGGCNGELTATMQYFIQGINTDDPKLKDVLMDIGTEELSHLEVVGTLVRAHLQTTAKDRWAAEATSLLAIMGGGGINFYNSQGRSWTADYLRRHQCHQSVGAWRRLRGREKSSVQSKRHESGRFTYVTLPEKSLA